MSAKRSDAPNAVRHRRAHVRAAAGRQEEVEEVGRQGRPQGGDQRVLFHFASIEERQEHHVVPSRLPRPVQRRVVGSPRRVPLLRPPDGVEECFPAEACRSPARRRGPCRASETGARPASVAAPREWRRSGRPRRRRLVATMARPPSPNRAPAAGRRRGTPTPAGAGRRTARTRATSRSGCWRGTRTRRRRPRRRRRRFWCRRRRRGTVRRLQRGCRRP
mmetsp:Transcript_37882/g.74163  ORF Transcript_37882/g.74163 Transcript_37882/m.74163 type:complete len:219 (-) Transcript_37882:166-822(-)